MAAWLFFVCTYTNTMNGESQWYRDLTKNYVLKFIIAILLIIVTYQYRLYKYIFGFYPTVYAVSESAGAYRP